MVTGFAIIEEQVEEKLAGVEGSTQHRAMTLRTLEEIEPFKLA
jgi:hypothetical protein